MLPRNMTIIKKNWAASEDIGDRIARIRASFFDE